MDINKLIDDMPEDVYLNMKSAAELGKWADGSLLTDEQKDFILQLVMLYQARRLNQTDHFTISAGGEINELSKAELKKQFIGETIAEFKQEDL